MKCLLKEIEWLLKHKVYVIALAITAVCGYGFMITHPTIGIDDTAMDLYLQEGYVVEVDRWVMYLLNKVFYFGDFAPFMTDLVGVLFLMVAASLFCVYLRRVLGERVGIVPCTIFACLFVSNPIISAVYVYYFHNGIGIGYMLTALALLFYEEVLRQKGSKKWKSLLGSMICVWVAVGCYESFMIVYILGILFTVFAYGVADRVKLSTKFVLMNLLLGAGVVLGGMVLRAVIVPVIIAVFGIGGHEELMSARSLTGIFSLFTGEGVQELIMLLKRHWVVYHVNALVYLPITGYNLACLCVGIYALVMLFKKKNFWYPLLFVGMIVTPFLLTLLDTKVTFYRTCQYIPFFTAIGFVLFYLAFRGSKIQLYWKRIATVIGVVLIFNQASDLNYNFYMDYQEYEHEKEMLVGAVYDVWTQYGDDTPIIFTGTYDMPYEFVDKYYVSYHSWQYRVISTITDLVDVHLKEKYFQPQGYCFVGERNLPLIRWGFDAFDGTNGELVTFLKMHGYTVKTITDEAVLKDARSYGENMNARWPQEGSIVMRDGYVLVNF